MAWDAFIFLHIHLSRVCKKWKKKGKSRKLVQKSNNAALTGPQISCWGNRFRVGLLWISTLESAALFWHQLRVVQSSAAMRHIDLRCVSLLCVAFHCFASHLSHCFTLRRFALLYVALRYIALHFISQRIVRRWVVITAHGRSASYKGSQIRITSTSLSNTKFDWIAFGTFELVARFHEAPLFEQSCARLLHTNKISFRNIVRTLICLAFWKRRPEFTQSKRKHI